MSSRELKTHSAEKIKTIFPVIIFFCCCGASNGKPVALHMKVYNFSIEKYFVIPIILTLLFISWLEWVCSLSKGNSTCDEKLRIVYTNFDKSLSINSCNAEK